MRVFITKLPADEWQKYRDIRLLALKTDPVAFRASYEEEMTLSEADWRDRINIMWFAKANTQAVGMVGLLKREGASGQFFGEMVSLWVSPEFRRKGIARLLVSKLQELALALSLSKISLEVNSAQISAIKLYKNLGFIRQPYPKERLPKGEGHLDKFRMEWSVPGH